MLAVVNVVLPVFAIMAAGYLCGRLGLLGQGSSQALNGFVYYVALPALFFIATARVPVDQVLNGPFLAAYGGGVVAVVLLALAVGRWVFRLNLAELTLHAMSAMFANTGYMGISLLFVAYGEVGRLPAIITSIFNVPASSVSPSTSSRSNSLPSPETTAALQTGRKMRCTSRMCSPIALFAPVLAFM